MNEDSINVRIEANAAGVQAGMNQASGSVVDAVHKMDGAFDGLAASSRAVVDEMTTALSTRLPAASGQAVNALNRVAVSAGAQRQGMQILAYQINDVSTQFAMGTNPMMIFAQQGSQVVQAIALMRGEAGGLIGFLAGPWGAAILGAVSILGVLVSSHQRAAAANKEHEEAKKDLTQATRELNEATQREITTTQASIQKNIEQARALRDRALAARQAALAELELARARIQSAQQYLGSGIPSKGGTEIAGGQIASATADMERLNAEIARQNANIARNEQTMRANRGLQIQQEVAEATDASTAATGRYERRVYALTQALAAGRISEDAYRQGIQQATQARDAAEAAARSRGGSGGGGRTRAAPARTNDWDEQLTAMQIAHERINQENGTFFEFSKATEAQFWQNILNTQNLTAKERLDVERKYIAAATAVRAQQFNAQVQTLRTELDSFKNNQDRRLQIANEIADAMKQKYGEESAQYQQAQQTIIAITRQRAEQVKQINADIAQTQLTYALSELDQKQNDLERMEQLGAVSHNRVIQEELRFEEQRYQLQLEALNKKLELLQNDPDMNPEEYQRIKNQIFLLEQQHQQRMHQLSVQHQSVTQQFGVMAINNMTSTWSQGLAQIMNGTLSLGDAIKGLWKTIVGAVIQSIAQMVVQWITQKLIALVLDKATTGTMAAGQITANAGVAGSAAYASTAAIPIIGPALAPAAAATAMAGALSFMPMAVAGFAASRGFDIPSGMNPVTQLHQKEMVLPAQYADVIRKLADGNSEFTNGSSGDTFHIHTMDASGVREFLMKNHRAVGDAVRHHVRSGGRVGA